MFSISHLVTAARPKTLIASLSPIFIGTTMAYGQGLFHLWIFLFTLLTGVGIQVVTNFINDLFDFLKGADTKERKGPTRVLQAGLMTLSELKSATLALTAFIAICGSLLVIRGGIAIAFLVALALLLALAYTAGPFPLAYLGIAEIFILVFFGPVATGSTYYLQTLTWSPKAFLAGLSPGLISCSILIVNNLRDIAEDRKAKKQTLVVRFGTTFGKIEYALALTLACLTSLFLCEKRPLILLTLVCLFPATALIRIVEKTKDSYGYNPIFGQTGLFLHLYTFLFCLGWIV